VSSDSAAEKPLPLVLVLSPQVVLLPGRSATMSELDSVMQRVLFDRPVVDKPGLSGGFNINLSTQAECRLAGHSRLKESPSMP